MSQNRVVHFEIPANEPEALTKFYGALFGWNFLKADMPGPEYWLCQTGEGAPGIDGAIMQRQHPQQPWTNYVQVESIDATIEKATAIGAQVALPKMPVADMGSIAALIDPQGNLFGLWEVAKK